MDRRRTGHKRVMLSAYPPRLAAGTNYHGVRRTPVDREDRGPGARLVQLDDVVTLAPGMAQRLSQEFYCRYALQQPTPDQGPDSRLLPPDAPPNVPLPFFFQSASPKPKSPTMPKPSPKPRGRPRKAPKDSALPEMLAMLKDLPKKRASRSTAAKPPPAVAPPPAPVAAPEPKPAPAPKAKPVARPQFKLGPRFLKIPVLGGLSLEEPEPGSVAIKPEPMPPARQLATVGSRQAQRGLAPAAPPPSAPGPSPAPTPARTTAMSTAPTTNPCRALWGWGLCLGTAGRGHRLCGWCQDWSQGRGKTNTAVRRCGNCGISNPQRSSLCRDCSLVRDRVPGPTANHLHRLGFEWAHLVGAMVYREHGVAKDAWTWTPLAADLYDWLIAPTGAVYPLADGRNDYLDHPSYIPFPGERWPGSVSALLEQEWRRLHNVDRPHGIRSTQGDPCHPRFTSTEQGDKATLRLVRAVPALGTYPAVPLIRQYPVPTRLMTPVVAGGLCPALQILNWVIGEMRQDIRDYLSPDGHHGEVRVLELAWQASVPHQFLSKDDVEHSDMYGEPRRSLTVLVSMSGWLGTPIRPGSQGLWNTNTQEDLYRDWTARGYHAVRAPALVIDGTLRHRRPPSSLAGTTDDRWPRVIRHVLVYVLGCPDRLSAEECAQGGLKFDPRTKDWPPI